MVCWLKKFYRLLFLTYMMLLNWVIGSARRDTVLPPLDIY